MSVLTLLATRTGSVEYRDMDLGSQREVIYADTVVALLKTEEGASVFDLDERADVDRSSSDESLLHDDDVIYQVIYQEFVRSSMIDNWEKLQYITDGLPPPFHQYPPLSFASPPSTASTAVADLEYQIDFIRPTTSSTESSISDESLRRVRTHSTVSARAAHSRNVSDMSATTVFSNETNDYVQKFQMDMSSSFFEQVGWLKTSEQNKSMECEETWGYEDENGPGGWDYADAVSHATRDEGCYFTDSPKCLSLHNETVDDMSYGNTYETAEAPKVIAKSYAKFNDAFTRQMKEYSSLLDELADPDGTAQALKLVNNKPGVYLHAKSASCTSFGGASFLESRSTRESERRGSSKLATFVDDEDPETWASNIQFVASTTPMSTSFAEIAQFIDEGDSDLDLEDDGLVRPTLSRFPAWNRSTGGGVDRSESVQ